MGDEEDVNIDNEDASFRLAQQGSLQGSLDVLGDAGLGPRLVQGQGSEEFGDSFKALQREDPLTNSNLNNELTGEYQKPEKSLARDYRKYHHPHQEDGSLKPVCSTPTAQFYHCCGCCFKKQPDTMLVYGPGVSSYFQYLKFMGYLFAVLIIFSIPQLTFNILSGGYFTTSILPLAQTTLGNLFRAPQVVNETIVFDFNNYVLRLGVCSDGIDGVPIEIINTVCSVPRSFLLMAYALLDILMMIIFLIGVFLADRGIHHEASKFARQVPRLEDYSLQVFPLPKDTTSEDLREHFIKLVEEKRLYRNYNRESIVYEAQVQEMSGRAIALCIARGKLTRQAARLNAYVKRLRKSHHGAASGGQDAFDLMNNDNEERGTLVRSKSTSVRRVQKAAERFQKIQEKIVEIDTETVALIDKSAEELHFGYVTFNSQWLRNLILKDYSKFRICGQPKNMKIKGTRIYARAAPAPSTLIWENNEVGRFSRAARSCISLFILVLVLVLSAGISYVSDQEKAFKTLTDISAELTPDQVCDGKYDGVDIVTGIAIATDTDDKQCFCEQILFQVLDQFDPTINTTVLAALNLSSVPTVTTIFNSGEFCDGALDSTLLSVAASIGISLSTLVLNVVIFTILYATAQFVRYPNFGRREFVVMRRLFLLTFINTAIIVLIVNADLVRVLGIPEEYFAFGRGDFIDFSAEWYQQVGLEIMVIGLLNVFAPHVYPLSKAAYRWGLRTFTHPLSQSQLNELYLGPEFQLSFRYAQFTMMIWYILMYSTGIPIMYFFGLLACIFTYWVDKYMFLRVCRSPPQYDVQLGVWANDSLLYAVVLHLLIGFWMISSTVLFPVNGDDTSLGIIEALGSSTGTDVASFVLSTNVTLDGLESLAELGNSIVRRAVRDQSIPYLTMFALILAGRLLAFVLSNGADAFVRPCTRRLYKCCVFCCQGSSRIKVKNNADITEVNTYETFGIPSYAILANPKYSHAFQLQDNTQGSNLKELLSGNAEVIEGLTKAIDEARVEIEEEIKEKRMSFMVKSQAKLPEEENDDDDEEIPYHEEDEEDLDEDKNENTEIQVAVVSEEENQENNEEENNEDNEENEEENNEDTEENNEEENTEENNEEENNEDDNEDEGEGEGEDGPKDPAEKMV